jgi:hypothetical protein
MIEYRDVGATGIVDLCPKLLCNDFRMLLPEDPYPEYNFGLVTCIIFKFLSQPFEHSVLRLPSGRGDFSCPAVRGSNPYLQLCCCQALNKCDPEP